MPLQLYLRSLHSQSHKLTPTGSLPFLCRSMSTSGDIVSPSTTRVGWIGTGIMGCLMCPHIIKAGYKLTVFNRTVSKAQPLLDLGANLASSPLASSLVGLVEGMIYAKKAGLDVGLFLNAISTGAAGSKSLDLYGSKILKRDFQPGGFVDHFLKDMGICLKECQNMGIALPGLTLAHQLYVSLMAYGEGNLGVQALILSLERLNNVSLDDDDSGGSGSS